MLTSGLQLVAINLTATENSQEIFETLNARGTPLTAADLIKNFVFQRLAAEGTDTRRAYAEDWPFDTKFWESEVSVGRYRVSRSSLFLNQWLASRLGEEISPQRPSRGSSTFVEHDAGQKMGDLLPTIKGQADLYESWTVAADDKDRQLTGVEMSLYRMKASGLELLKPLLIWLHEPECNLTSRRHRRRGGGGGELDHASDVSPTDDVGPGSRGRRDHQDPWGCSRARAGRPGPRSSDPAQRVQYVLAGRRGDPCCSHR